jgi:hypothetical protein
MSGKQANRRACRGLLCILLLSGVVAAQDTPTEGEAFETKEWEWEAPVTFDAEALGFQRMHLSLECLARSKTSLSDLRVLDAKGKLTPHVLYRPPAVVLSRREWKSVRLINRSFTPEEHARVTLDFGKAQRKNQIKIQLSEINYRRKILVEGSADGIQWGTVAEDQWLFNVNPFPDQEYKVDTISMPANDFRYLRLTAYNMEDDPRRIEFLNVDAALEQARPEKTLLPVSFEFNPVTPEEHEKKQTINEFDLAYKNFPLDSLVVHASDSYFHRAYELLGRNAATEKIPRKTETGWDETERDVPWKPIRHGILYRIHEEDDAIVESTTLETLRAPYRFLKLRIHNRDNPPLSIEGFTLSRRETQSVVFMADAEQQYRLIGGNPKATMPSYDLAQAVKGIAEQELATATLGELSLLSHEASLEPFTERYAVFIWAVMLLAVAAVLALIMKNISRLQHPDQKTSDS